MARVVVVGAGLYGLIAAKTYLQVAEIYKKSPQKPDIYADEVPACFASSGHADIDPALLIIDEASGLGGTWAAERLYPNLLSQNSYGLYEFSDLPLATAVPSGPDDTDGQFIAGWKINKYLHIWSKRWDLLKYMRFNWKVVSVSRLPSKEWKLEIVAGTKSITLVCDKLVIATGLTSVPNMPEIPQLNSSDTIPNIHAKYVGDYCRENLGYEPVPTSWKTSSPEDKFDKDKSDKSDKSENQLQSVAIQGGAKSSFDFVNLFASLHRNIASHNLDAKHANPVQVHWIVREQGAGVAWMAPPMSDGIDGKPIASDKAASSRLVGMLSPCVHYPPKRISLVRSSWGWRLGIEGCWIRRLLHENPLGRWVTRYFWRSVDRTMDETAQYSSDAKMEKLRPTRRVIDCASSGGIANHSDFWETIQASNVHVHRSEIKASSGSTVRLADGTKIPSVDLVIQATGWKPVVPIQFQPSILGHAIGISHPVQSIEPDSEQSHIDSHWRTLDEQTESNLRRIFHPSTFAQSGQALRSHDTTPYRLFRRMVSPSLVGEGDRSLVVLGVVLSGTIAVVAEVQALWAAAFLTGGLDKEVKDQGPIQAPLSINAVAPEKLREAVSEDVVWGDLTGSGLDVDAIHYNDILLRDLGLNPNRAGGGMWNELTAVYGPSSYAGVVDEWLARRA